MKTLFLIRGIPGSGKTFTADLLSENGKYPVLSADMFFVDSEGNYNWDASKIKDAHAWCLNMTDRCMHCNDGWWHSTDDYRFKHTNTNKIFVTNTFTQEWEMEPYFKLAEKYGYTVVTLICENRHGGTNIHNVPEETIEKMKNRFEVKL